MSEDTADTGENNISGDGEGSNDSVQTGPFYSALSPEMQAHPNAEKFKSADIETVFKSYNEASSMVGRDKIVRPNMEDSADVQRFYSELGVPDNPDGYEMGEVPEWAQEAGYDNTTLRNIAHKYNLTPDQAKGVEKDYLEDVRVNMERQTKEAEEAKGKNDQLLRTEMGDKYDEKMAQKDAVIDKFARTPESAQALKALADKDPLVAASLADIAAKFSEHSIGDFQPKSFAMSKDEAQAKVDAMRSNMKGPYWDDTDRVAHQNAVDEMQRLNRFIAGVK